MLLHKIVLSQQNAGFESLDILMTQAMHFAEALAGGQHNR